MLPGFKDLMGLGFGGWRLWNNLFTYLFGRLCVIDALQKKILIFFRNPNFHISDFWGLKVWGGKKTLLYLQQKNVASRPSIFYQHSVKDLLKKQGLEKLTLSTCVIYTHCNPCISHDSCISSSFYITNIHVTSVTYRSTYQIEKW